MRKPPHSRLRATLLPLALGTCGSIGLQAVSAPLGHADHPRHGQHADRSAAGNRLGRFLGIGWSDGYHACPGCLEASRTPASVDHFHVSPPAAVLAPGLPAAPWPAAPVEWLPPQTAEPIPEEFSLPRPPAEAPAPLPPPAAAAPQPQPASLPLPQAGVPQHGSAASLRPAERRVRSHSPRRLPKPAGLEQDAAELSVLRTPPAALRPVSLPLRPWEPNR